MLGFITNTWWLIIIILTALVLVITLIIVIRNKIEAHKVIELKWHSVVSELKKESENNSRRKDYGKRR